MTRWQVLSIATFGAAIAIVGASFSVAGLVYFAAAVYAALRPALAAEGLATPFQCSADGCPNMPRPWCGPVR